MSEYTTEYRYVRVALAAVDLAALAERYAGLRFTQAEATWIDGTCDGDDDFACTSTSSARRKRS